MPRMRRSIQERFDEKYTPEPNSGCWLWTASSNGLGYGKIYLDGKMELAHRISWILQNGEIPKGKGHHGTCVLHKCDTPACVNPEHLFLGSIKDNAQDKASKDRSYKPSGELHHNAFLDEIRVRIIKRLIAFKTLKLYQIAEIFGVDSRTISHIKCGRRWAHIES